MNETLKIWNLNKLAPVLAQISLLQFSPSISFFFKPVRQMTQFCVVCWAICQLEKILLLFIWTEDTDRWATDNDIWNMVFRRKQK